MRITNELLEAFLNCKTKAYRKLGGHVGIKSDYEVMTEAAIQSAREATLARLSKKCNAGDVPRGLLITSSALKLAAPLLIDAIFEDERTLIRFDAIKRDDKSPASGGNHYIPILHSRAHKAGRREKLMLAIVGMALGRAQGLRPAQGIVAPRTG